MYVQESSSQASQSYTAIFLQKQRQAKQLRPTLQMKAQACVGTDLLQLEQVMLLQRIQHRSEWLQLSMQVVIVGSGSSRYSSSPSREQKTALWAWSSLPLTSS